MRVARGVKHRISGLEGKRLLVLGSTYLIAEIVAKAQSMGVVVGVADYVPYENAIGKQVADEFYDTSISDIEAVAALVKERRFDGVLTGFADSYLPYYLDICRAADVPCYGGKHQFSIAIDKSVFKDVCIAAGVPVIPGNKAADIDSASEIAQRIGYPVIIKPIDNSGSRGVVKCEAADGLEASFQYAHGYSPSGNVILEKYMDCDNMAASYYFVDGQIAMSSCCDRGLYVSSATGSSVTSTLAFPSKHYSRYKAELDDLVRKMLIDNGFRDGMLSLQAFVDEEGFYLCEMCYRPSGGHNFALISDQAGVDELGMLIEFALTGSSSPDCLLDENPEFPDRCFMINVLGQAGATVGSFSGHDSVKAHPSVIWALQRADVGGAIGADGTTAQVVESIWFRCVAGEDANALSRDILNLLSVKDDQGNSLIVFPTPETLVLP